MWLIWKERNRWVFEQKELDPFRVINMANRAIEEYWRAKGWCIQREEDAVKATGYKGWKAPESGFIEVNCDGSYKEEDAGIGLVCRHKKGVFFWGFGEKVVAESAVVAEIFAMRKALLLIEEVGADKVVIEVDCSEIYWCCKRKSVEGVDWKGNWEMQDVLNVLGTLRNVKVTLVPREGNMAADWIAVRFGRGEGSIGWVEIPPLPLAGILANDLKNWEEAKTFADSVASDADTDVRNGSDHGRFEKCGIG